MMTQKAMLMVGLSVCAFALLVSASPAYAVTRCTYNERNIDLPNKPDVRLLIDVCVELNDVGNVRAKIKVRWEPEIIIWATGRKFDNLEVHTALQRGSSNTVESHVCDWTAKINDDWRGEKTCYTEWYSASNHRWTADGSIRYDRDNDGRGPMAPLQLRGSPSVAW